MNDYADIIQEVNQENNISVQNASLFFAFNDFL